MMHNCDSCQNYYCNRCVAFGNIYVENPEEEADCDEFVSCTSLRDYYEDNKFNW